jgi:hypothetical protein
LSLGISKTDALEKLVDLPALPVELKTGTPQLF